ncbi:MAG: DUF2505 domain-containing protein [Nigerium sp.]|nr:DUF2505 domain-containing protein [Nigerium sp.]
MHLTSRHELPADPDTAFAMLTDPAFLERAARSSGATGIRADASATRTAVQASVEAPAPLQAFLGAQLSFTQVVVWGERDPDGGRLGRVSIDVARTPASVAGTVTLVPTASGSALSWDGELTVSVPLLGATIERQAAPVIQETLDGIGREARAWLDR